MDTLNQLVEQFDANAIGRNANKADPPQVVHLVPRTRTVPPLTDQEIVQLRTMLCDVRKVVSACPIARKTLRGDPD